MRSWRILAAATLVSPQLDMTPFNCGPEATSRYLSR